MDASLVNTIRTRPRFKYITHLSKEKYLELLKNYFSKKNKKIGGYINSEQCVFRIRETKDDFWSPCLQLRVEENPEENVTYVHGLFGPKPEYWTMFMFFYFGFLTLSVMLLSFYVASLAFSPSPFLLVLGIFFLVLVFGLFAFSKIGQIRTKNQMRLLKTFILMVIKEEQIQEKGN